MLKFVKHHMETILGIEIYPVISFLIFSIFFVLVTIWILKMDKKQVDQLANIPINDKSKN